MKHWIVTNKSDDYGNCTEELVETTLENANAYYGQKEVPDEDISVLKKYFTYVPYSEEKQRTDDQRFYGND